MKRVFLVIILLNVLIPVFTQTVRTIPGRGKTYRFDKATIMVFPTHIAKEGYYHPFYQKQEYVPGELLSVSFRVEHSVPLLFSELDEYLKQTDFYEYYSSVELSFDFRGGSSPQSIPEFPIIVDTETTWISKIRSVSFLYCDVILNGIVFSNVRSFGYSPAQFDHEFYKSFPNVESLNIFGVISDLSFLQYLPNLKFLQMNTRETDKVILSKMFRQYYEYRAEVKNNFEDFPLFGNSHNYPLNENYIAPLEPPEWYDGPDISGIFAWLNDTHVNVRTGPSLNASIIKQLNTGDCVLIKGQENEDWIKVRLLDRTDGYIFGEYLTLKNPKFFPIVEEPYVNPER